MPRTENVKTEAPFKQVCLWPCTIVGEARIQQFVEFFQEDFGTRVQYLEEITTLPDVVNGVEVPGTGGRNDVYFAVHEGDIPKFAVPRLRMNIRWIEDVLRNEQDRIEDGKQSRSIYPERVQAYKTW